MYFTIFVGYGKISLNSNIKVNSQGKEVLTKRGGRVFENVTKGRILEINQREEEER